MGQINTNNYPTVNSLADADLLIVENAANGTGTTTPKQLRENAIGTGTLQTSAQTVIGAVNELKGEIDAGAGVVCYDVDTITSGYLGGQFSGSANLLLLHLTTDGTADATNGYMMMLSYTRPVARFAYGRLVDADGVAYKQDVYADSTIICTISGSGEGTESDPEQVVILGIINAGFMLTPTAVVSDRDIQDGQGNTLSVLAEALTKTASGNPVVIDDCAGGKARSLITSINAIQDLHGLPFPYVGGAYKNKLPLDVATIKRLNTVGTWNGNVYTVNGGTFTIQTDNDGNVTGAVANGTFTEKAFLIFVNSNDMTTDFAKTILGKTIILNGCPTRTGNPYAQMFNTWGTTSPIYDNGSDPATLAVPSTISGYRCQIEIYAGTVSNVLFLPMIRLSTESDASFAPYSNICPISGRDSVVVERTSKNFYNINDLHKDGNVTYTVVNDTLTIVSSASRPKIYYTPSNIFSGQTVVFSFTIGSITNGGGAVFFGLVIRNSATSTVRYVSASNCTTTGNKSVSATLTANEYIERIDFNVNDTATALSNDRTYVISNIQLEFGSTPTSYQPYAHSSVTVQLGQTVYGADINWDTGVMTVKTALVTYDETSGFAKFDTVAAGTRYVLYQPVSPIAKVTTNNFSDIISNLFKGVTRDPVNLGEIALRASSVPQWLMLVSDKTTIEAFNADIAANNIQVCYPLATPTTVQLTPEQLEMLKGYNRVSIEDGSIEIGYIAKLT